MKLSRLFPRGRNRRVVAAFTMVELVLCIGIVAFAMVAIMGVLPSGLNVQRQNREDTLIDQEGPQWISILRDGQIGWDELPNYLDFLLVERTALIPTGPRQVYGFRGPYFADTVLPPNAVLDSASNIVSFLSIPKFEADQGTVYSNRVTAVFRSLSGAQNTQVRPGVIVRPDGATGPSEQQLDDSFRYQMQVEFTPITTMPTVDMGLDRNQDFTNQLTRENLDMGGLLNAIRLDDKNLTFLTQNSEKRADRDALSATLYDVRLTFRWPVYKVGEDYVLGSGHRTFRTQVLGRPRFSLLRPGITDSVYWPGTKIRPRRFDPAIINRDLSF